MEGYITIMNLASFDTRVTIFSGHEQKQYGINSGGQVVHSFTASEDRPYHFKARAQQMHGPIHSHEAEGNAISDLTIRVVLDTDGKHLSFAFEKEEGDF